MLSLFSNILVEGQLKRCQELVMLMGHRLLKMFSSFIVDGLRGVSIYANVMFLFFIFNRSVKI